jgi:hypothetical protein
LSNYGDVYQNRRLTHQPDEQGVQTGGLLWDAARQGLWIAYGGVYNVAAFHDPSIMFVSFAGSSPVAYGPWRTSQHSQRTRDYMVMLDSGQPAVGAAPHSGNANSPAGSWLSELPSFNPLTTPPDSLNDNDHVTLATLDRIVHDDAHPQARPAGSSSKISGTPYYGTCPALKPNNDFYNGSLKFDMINGAARIKTSAVQGVVMVGQITDAVAGATNYGSDSVPHIWYGPINSDDCSGQHPLSWDSSPGTGPHSASTVPWLWIYDPASWASTAQPAEKYAVRLDSLMSTVSVPLSNDQHQFGGMAFDPATGLLFLVENGKDRLTNSYEPRPVIHVFQVGSGGTYVPPAATAPVSQPVSGPAVPAPAPSASQPAAPAPAAPVTSSAASCSSSIPMNAWLGCYYGNIDFTGLYVTRTDAAINFTLSSDTAINFPDSTTFSIVWQGNFAFENAVYDFTAVSDDGMRVYIDGQSAYDNWTVHPAATSVFSKAMTQGNHLIRVEYFQDAGEGVAKFSWSKAGGTVPTPVVTLPSASSASSIRIGTAIQTTANVNVRASGGGTLLGTQPAGSVGTIIAGPTYSNGVTWWQIDYANAPDGWSGDGYLAAYTAPAPAPASAPTDAVLSDWSAWTDTSAWSACIDGTQTKTQQRTRTVLAAATGGGSTGPLVGTQTISQSCTAALPSPTPVQTPSSTGSKFAIGQAVQTSSTVNVRSSASALSRSSGRQIWGATGTIIGGPVTGNGYTWWQVDYAVSPDGWTAEDYLAAYTPPTGSTLSMQLTKDLFFGMSNDEVLLLQKFLIAKGYLSADLNTGYFGTATYNAVRSYQRAGGISSTGIVGPLTRAKINGELSGMDL